MSLAPRLRLAALGRPARWAAGASLAWAVLVLAYGIGFLSVAGAGQERGTLFLDAMFFLVALVLPVLLLCLAAWLAGELTRQREIVAALAEAAAPLAGALSEGRAALDPQEAASAAAVGRALEDAIRAVRQDLAASLERIAAGQARIEAALRHLAAEGLADSPVAGPAEVVAVPEVAEMTRAEAGDPDRPTWADFVRALDFPRDAGDRDGFRALKTALRHPGLAQMLQAAEDVLNLLSQEGVYVDDLPMEPADPAAWRRFMAGIRGPEIAGLGGIRDPEALAAARGLMKSDSIFRDTALFFQRRFDSILADFARGADDEALVELAGTRSGRAFMLLARLGGTLD